MRFVDKLQGMQEGASVAEWYVMAWVTRLVMIAAILANWKKAADTLQVMSKPGGPWSVWDPFMLAFALEGAFALAAYFLSMQVQRRKGSSRLQVAVLAVSVPVLGLLSGVANVDYFLRYSDVASLWGQWRAVLMGAAAPLIAVLTAVLAGTVAGMAQGVAEDRRGAEGEIRQHDLALAREKTAQARADARKVKAASLRSQQVAGTVPAMARKGNGNRDWTPETLLAEFPDAASWSGREIGALAGVGERQGRNWRVRMEELAGEK